MKTLVVTGQQLKNAGRWDIDFHLPPAGIQRFPRKSLVAVSMCADIIKKKRDPSARPDDTFKYVDISSVDVETGTVARPQELTGEEAPSRARKVIHAYDIIISTCRPTRGAIAVVPEELHGEICSTGYSVVRAKENVNPFYLHFALRLDSTLEQFRKWSTGSSYPAILDEDVAKTLIPLPDSKTQDKIAKILRAAMAEREKAIRQANDAWRLTVGGIIANLSNSSPVKAVVQTDVAIYSIKQIQERLASLSPIADEADADEDELLFTEDDEEEVS